MKIDLNRIAFIGRTFHEYSHMFDLTDDLLRGRVLDCPAGASSFTAECIRQGYDVTACDVLCATPFRFMREADGMLVLTR